MPGRKGKHLAPAVRRAARHLRCGRCSLIARGAPAVLAGSESVCGGLCFPRSRKRDQGHPGAGAWLRCGRDGFLLSHPCDNNKDVARMGHPAPGTCGAAYCSLLARGEGVLDLSPVPECEGPGAPGTCGAARYSLIARGAGVPCSSPVPKGEGPGAPDREWAGFEVSHSSRNGAAR
jgi:hypothetical protein